MDEKAQTVIERYDRLKKERYNFESHWQDIQWLVRPHTSYFLNQTSIQGDRRTLYIFDSTAPYCLGQLAAGLHSSLTSSTDRWFNLTTVNEDLMQDDEVLAWLEIVSDIIYLQYSLPGARLNTNLHENYLDLGAFGTSILYQDFNVEMQQLRFKAFPLAECVIEDDAAGLINRVYHQFKWTYNQAKDFFKELPKQIEDAGKKDPLQKFEFIHGVYPRDIYDPKKKGKQDMRFESCWVNRDHQVVVKEDGFRDFPFHVPRWATIAGEIYGRSPAMECLPDIKMLNEMAKVAIRAAQKSVDPPLMVPNSGYGKSLKTSPASIIWKEPGTEEIKALEVNRNFQIGSEMVQQKQDIVSKTFFLDELIMPQKKERESVLERQQNREQQLRQMSPHVGRLESELCGPMLNRSYSILRFAGVIPPPPSKLKGSRITIEYVSPAARAQVSGKANAIRQLIQDATPLMQVDQEVTDAIDFDEALRQLAILGDVTRRVMRAPRDIQDIRKKREQQKQIEQAQQLSQAGQQAGQGILNVAKAQSLATGPAIAARG